MTSTTGASAAVAPPAEEQAAVAAVMKRIVDAWGAYDADAFANTFTEDGTMILPGLYRKGRDEIRDYMAKGFAGPYQGTQVTGVPFDVRFLAEDTALLLSLGGVLGPGETEVAKDKAVRAAWLLVKREGEWLLAAYQNSPSES